MQNTEWMNAYFKVIKVSINDIASAIYIQYFTVFYKDQMIGSISSSSLLLVLFSIEIKPVYRFGIIVGTTGRF